jgi:hypothetical protein
MRPSSDLCWGFLGFGFGFGGRRSNVEKLPIGRPVSARGKAESPSPTLETSTKSARISACKSLKLLKRANLSSHPHVTELDDFIQLANLATLFGEDFVWGWEENKI